MYLDIELKCGCELSIKATKYQAHPALFTDMTGYLELRPGRWFCQNHFPNLQNKPEKP